MKKTFRIFIVLLLTAPLCFGQKKVYPPTTIKPQYYTFYEWPTTDIIMTQKEKGKTYGAKVFKVEKDRIVEYESGVLMSWFKLEKPFPQRYQYNDTEVIRWSTTAYHYAKAGWVVGYCHVHILYSPDPVMKRVVFQYQYERDYLGNTTPYGFLYDEFL